VTSAGPLDILPLPEDYPAPRVLGAGRATGPLAGGNLSLTAALLGTPYELDTRGRILLLEEVGEGPYRVDRMLAQLSLAGKLRAAAGVAVGEMVECDPPPAPGKDGNSASKRAADAAPGSGKPDDGNGEDSPPAPSLTVDEVLKDHLAGLGLPVLYGLPFGHGRDKWTVPFGVLATLDAYKARLVIEEAACESGS